MAVGEAEANAGVSPGTSSGFNKATENTIAPAIHVDKKDGWARADVPTGFPELPEYLHPSAYARDPIISPPTSPARRNRSSANHENVPKSTSAWEQRKRAELQKLNARFLEKKNRAAAQTNA